MWPVGLSVSNSSKLARPSQTFRVTEVPSNWTQVVEPTRRSWSRDKWIFQRAYLEVEIVLAIPLDAGVLGR